MLAFNPIKGEPVGGSISAGERVEEIVPFLKWVKDILGGKDPEFVTIDFKEAWEVAVKLVFPHASIIICTFHATQLLTRGLLKEFNRLQRERNSTFIRECGAARAWALQCERGAEKAPPPTLTHPFCLGWAKFHAQIRLKFTGTGPETFAQAYRDFLASLKAWDAGTAARYEVDLAPKVPKRGFTAKGAACFQGEMEKKWRGILLDARQEREAKKRELASAKFLLLKRQENLSAKDAERLGKFLQANEWARVPRETLLRFYALLGDPEGKDTSLDFLDALVLLETHNWLKSAVGTLKAKKEYVFNFTQAWQAHPQWKDIRALKVNPEHVMKKVNAVARAQYGFRSAKSARFKLERALHCPVIISPQLPSETGNDLVLN